ncbi:unnamed protein product, partial [Porites evermanni]
MPNVTVSSLKKENDNLKDEITALKRKLEELQQSIKRQDPQVTTPVTPKFAVIPSRKVGDSIEQLQRYSFQYNIKIICHQESETRESASQTASLCINLFKVAGIEISNRDIDIAHRIPTRTATSGPRPIVCKFKRRIVKEQ